VIDGFLPDGLIIAFSRVSAEGIITVKFLNISDAVVDPPLTGFQLTVVN